MTDPKSTELDVFFAAAKENVPTPNQDLMARVMADAAALQPQNAGFAPVAKPGVWESFLDMIGGWPALSGVAAAGVAGVWLGVAPPVSLEQLTSDVMGTNTSISLLSDVGGLLGETIDG